jgi:hypothetical protein
VRWLLLVLALAAPPALALSSAAREFMEISAQLEPVQCEKRKLRRAITLAQVEGRAADAKRMRARFAALDADPRNARLEKRLAELERRVHASRDAEDLDAISFQQRKAFYNCE